MHAKDYSNGVKCVTCGGHGHHHCPQNNDKNNREHNIGNLHQKDNGGRGGSNGGKEGRG